MCKFMYNISTVSSVSVEVVNKIKFEFSKKKKQKKKRCVWENLDQGPEYRPNIKILTYRPI